ncbi:sulfur transferase domain-containing protein [Stenotrophomonas sp. CD2]|nr:sulfur transferase domain-containing protein [Stenotrophomonas sp. CD2]
MLLRLTCLLLLSLCLPLTALAEDAPLNEVRPGLYAGGQPSAVQLQALAAQGVRTVIDLRQPGEDRGFDETRVAESLGLRYVRIPVAGAEGLDAANVRAVHQALQQSQGRCCCTAPPATAPVPCSAWSMHATNTPARNRPCSSASVPA